MTAEKHKSVFFIMRLSHAMEEFLKKRMTYKVLPQGSEFNIFTPINSKSKTHIKAYYTNQSLFRSNLIYLIICILLIVVY